MSREKDIAQYLKKLLFSYNDIVVPGLGQFKTKYVSANLKEGQSLITPPRKTVVFDANYEPGDAILLINHIARAEKKLESDVQQELNDFVTALQAKLDNGEQVLLPEIGTFTKKAPGNIYFEAVKDVNFSLDTYGLGAIDLPELATGTTPDAVNTSAVGAGKGIYTSAENETDLPKEKDVPPVRETTVSNMIAEKANKSVKADIPPPTDVPEKRRSRGFFLWLLPLLALGVFIFLLTRLSSDKDNQLASNKPKTEQNKTIANNTNANSAVTNKNNNSNNKNTANNNTRNNNTNTKTSTNTNTNTNTSANSKSGKEANKVDVNANANKGNSSTSANTGDKGTTNNSNANTTKTKTVTPPAPPKKDPPKKTTTNDSKTDTGNAKDNIAVTQSKENEYVNTNSPKGYYIIVGAFKSQKNAQKLANKIKKESLDAHVLQTTSGYYRAGIYCNNLEVAKTQYRKSRKSHNKGAWLLKYN